ncbi:probable ATP-dependent RNA helicase DDX28 [Oncorhynchus kisutch]|uniref:RNA helicase n=1 Tax=Oncorhynchus kisutch TaxID=8019 RepID=A0A8C7CV92_ONCKI|nr:probable ATP-dependent RNA helicase DDX28 [Oncorhynchus kisutch]
MQSVKVGYSVLFTLISKHNYSSSGHFRALACSHGTISSACGAHSMSTTAQPVVIRIPRHMQEQVENVKQVRGKNKVNTIKAGKLLIKSKNPELNQSAGYTLGKFEQPHLSSKGWKHNKSFGDYFTVNNTQRTPPVVTEIQDEEGDKLKEKSKPITFHNLHLCPDLVEALGKDNITRPTTVQLQTIPKLLKGYNILCAAETGSGKTLSYLLPVIHKLQAEKAADSESIETTPRTRSVIIVPSRELADQVSAVARSLCGPFGLMVKTVGGGRGVGNIKLAFTKGPPDVLVATPGALIKALRRRYLDLKELSFMVVDEADTMFDPSFSGMLESILAQTCVACDPSETQGPGSTRKAQLVVVGATFPGGVGEVLSQVTDLGSMVTIKSKNLHFLMPHVKQTFLKVRGADKLLELHQALKAAEQDKAGVLVFCNRASTVNWLGYSLEDMGLRHVRLQGEMPASLRAGIFHSFQKGQVDVLICTDIASRGLDTQRVCLVVNYDFPESHTDYIHRAGRVGRVGSMEDGEVLSFVTHPWDVELVQKIETAARRRTSLPGMESSIRKPEPKAAEEEEEEEGLLY